MDRNRTIPSRARGTWHSLWLAPAASVVVAITLAVVLIAAEDALGRWPGRVLPAGVAGVREILSAIVTSMITITALVFSITIVALQLTSSQFSPRVLRTFQQDRITKAALATFVATFAYAMVVLAAVPEEGATERIPQVATIVGMVLVLASVGIFIVYIQHMTTLIRVASIVAEIGSHTRRLLEQRYPSAPQPQSQSPSPSPPQPAPVLCTLDAPKPGVVADVDADRLAQLGHRHRCRLDLAPMIGDFVPAGAPLLLVRAVPGDEPGAPPQEAVEAVTLTTERTLYQDVNFGFRQLADIAERALSPGYNDITTALQAIDQVHDLLRRLATRPLRPWVVRDRAHNVRAVIDAEPDLDRFLRPAVKDIAYAGRQQPRVIERLTAMLDDILGVALPQHRPALRQCLIELPDIPRVGSA